jgi:hypothetical protein
MAGLLPELPRRQLTEAGMSRVRQCRGVSQHDLTFPLFLENSALPQFQITTGEISIVLRLAQVASWLPRLVARFAETYRRFGRPIRLYKRHVGCLPRCRPEAYVLRRSVEFPTPGLHGCHFYNRRAVPMCPPDFGA